jgi:hypothetical protein
LKYFQEYYCKLNKIPTSWKVRETAQ